MIKKKRQGPLPIGQNVDVHSNETFVAIEPLSGYRLIRPETGSVPEFFATDSDTHALGAALLAAHARSRFIPPEDQEFRDFGDMDVYARNYKNSLDQILRRTRKKTKREAFKDMIWCRARRSEGQIEIQPFRPDKPGTWKMLPKEMAVVIPTTDDPNAVGAALALALERARTFEG